MNRVDVAAGLNAYRDWWNETNGGRVVGVLTDQFARLFNRTLLGVPEPPTSAAEQLGRLVAQLERMRVRVDRKPR